VKLFTDQDVYRLTVEFLGRLGHEVLTAAEAGLARADDRDLVAFAHTHRRLLVTRDKDFGALAFTEGTGGGIVFLRISPSTVSAVHAEVRRVLETYPEEQLQGAFVVVEPGRHRLRRLS
jgi:predicted nuclease of predicted toxin-antitoxin system